MSRTYKIIRAPSIDRLILLVNEFLKTRDSDDYEFVGGPEVFGHEEYIQTFIGYKEDQT